MLYFLLGNVLPLTFRSSVIIIHRRRWWWVINSPLIEPRIVILIILFMEKYTQNHHHIVIPCNSMNQPPVAALDVNMLQGVSQIGRWHGACTLPLLIAFRTVNMFLWRLAGQAALVVESTQGYWDIRPNSWPVENWVPQQRHWQSRHWCLERVFALLQRTSFHFHWRICLLCGRGWRLLKYAELIIPWHGMTQYCT